MNWWLRSVVGGRARRSRRRRSLQLLCAFVVALQFLSARVVHAAEIGVTVAHPIFHQIYTCSEHWEGNLQGTGDALGSDCVIERMVEENGRKWMRMYAGDGRRNEDWFGWNEDVLAPCDCVVARVQKNTVTNEPGVMGSPPAAFIDFQRADGVHFLVAHVQSIVVTPGLRVTAGQPVAKVGNNGMSRHPHIHIGAWKGEVPLQIRFDLGQLGGLLQR